MSDLAPGTRSIFARFESAARDESLGALEPEMFDKFKQAMIRLLIRLQNKTPEDVEGIKRDLRKMMTVIEAIHQAPDQASRIIETTGALQTISQIRSTRKAHAYHAGVAAFQRQLDVAREQGRRQGLKEAKHVSHD